MNLQSKQIQEKDVELLKFLSVPLQKSLAFAVYKKTLTPHHMFREYGHQDLAAFQSLCQKATSKMLLAKDDVLFSAGQKSTQMWFVSRGCLRYHRERSHVAHMVIAGTKHEHSRNYDDSDRNRFQTMSTKSTEVSGNRNIDRMEKGEWCSEAALWTEWHHVGTLTAFTVCDMVGVSAEKFAEITTGHKEVEMMCSKYAQAYVKNLNDLDTDARTDLQ